MAFGNEIKYSNIQENWLFHFASSGADLYLSLSDVTDSGQFYHGVILNSPSIRESLNLASSTASTSNMSLKIPDFTYKEAPISETLVFGSTYFLNQVVLVYSKVNNQTKVLIGTFRLTDVKRNKDNLSLSLTAHRPWDFVSFPQTKTTANLITIPVSYGDYTENSATTFASPLFDSQFTSKKYRPIPFNKVEGSEALYVDGVTTSSSGELAVYEKGADIFVPCEEAQSSTVNTDNAHHGQIESSIKRAFKQRSDTAELVINNGTTIANIGNAIDTDDSTYAEFTDSIVNTDSVGTVSHNFHIAPVSGMKKSFFTTVKDADGDNSELAEDIDTSETGINISDDENLSPYDVIKIEEEEMNILSISSNTLTVERNFDGTRNTQTVSNGEDFSQDSTLNVVFVKYAVDITTLVGNQSHVKITTFTDGGVFSNTHTSDQSAITKVLQIPNDTKKIKIKVDFVSRDTGSTSPTLIANLKLYDVFTLTQRISEEPDDELYTANDGFVDNGWNSSSAITLVHEAHRDLLSRFAGLADSDPTGWSDLNSSKDWRIRYWQNESIVLQKALEKLQYEGGFIYHNGNYIHIKDSESADLTISKHDLKDITIGHTPFSEIQSKMNINYRKHPAQNRYMTAVTSTNSTTRTNYNIEDEENISEVNLDVYVGDSASENDIPTSATSNPNDDWYTYYNNIFGSVKGIISATIVNPRYYNDENTTEKLVGIGTRISFTDMYPEKILGKAFTSIIFMITDFKRTAGSIQFTAREIA